MVAHKTRQKLVFIDLYARYIVVACCSMPHHFAGLLSLYQTAWIIVFNIVYIVVYLCLWAI